MGDIHRAGPVYCYLFGMAVWLEAGPWSILLLVLTVGWASGEYLGCYEDKGGKNRLMSDHRMNLYDINTPKRCTHVCTKLGYRYAGLQNGVECFCSGERPGDAMKRPEADCSAPCPGNSKLFCGGSWRLSVHSGSVHPPPDAVYMGCYEDTARRLLSDLRFDLEEINTPKKCINLCKAFGFPYAGMEMGVQCFCSKQRPDDDSKKSDSDCNTFCPNTKHKCGGNWRLSVYTYPVDKASQLEISDDAVERMYLGCFEDNAGRILDEIKIDFPEILTPKKCMYVCKQLSYDYAGVQNGGECYCGNKRPSSDLKRAESECSVSCQFREQKCGGPWRMGVFSIE